MTAVPELRNDGIILNAHNDSEVAVHVAGYAASIGVTRLEAHAVPDNHASRHVAEAAGFTQADTFTDDHGTEFIRYTRDASGDRAPPSRERASGALPRTTAWTARASSRRRAGRQHA